jgi:hypothetical protein
MVLHKNLSKTKSAIKLFLILLISSFSLLSCGNDDTNFDDDNNDNGDDIIIIENAIYPKELVPMLGKGFDVAWSEFNKYIEAHDEQKVIDIVASGFSTVRIRVNKPADEDLFSHLDIQINQCLKHGLIPILAYQGHDAEDATDIAKAKLDITNWWRTIAERYKDYSELLVFNILVETSGNFKKDYELLNEFYASIIPAIRASNPHRILIVPPVGLSKPANLQYIQLPDDTDPFIMMEWHCYAAGPALTGNKQWTTGTLQERQLVLNHLNAAKEYMNQTGRLTWLGAWMVGNYNKGNDYDIPEQVKFATFFVREMEKIGVPWCVNTDDKYYDYLNLEWYSEGTYAGIPVRDVLIDTEKIALYKSEGYKGESVRLEPGEYDTSELNSYGFTNNISSFMIPWGFKIITYSETGFTGTKKEFIKTTKLLQPDVDNTFSSLKVVDLKTYY